MIGGRGLGLLWSLLLVAELGIDGFGQFAVAIAAGALIAIPVDRYYLVRAPRLGEIPFRADRTTRWIIGATLLVGGLALYPFWYTGGLALAKAGGDIAFNSRKSVAIRAGRPDRAYLLDSARQGLALAAGACVALLVEDTSLTVLSLVYVLALVPFLLTDLPLKHARPVLPEWTSSTRALIIEAICGAAYIQGDVVLVGILTSDADVGYYSLATLALWSAAGVGENYAITFHEPLRARGGHTAAGPTLRRTGILALAVGAAMLLAGAGLAALGADQVLWLCFIVLAPATSARLAGAVFSTILTLQSRDHLRMQMSVAGVAVKTIGILALAPSLGAVGAAVSFAVADLIITAWSFIALYRRPAQGAAR